MKFKLINEKGKLFGFINLIDLIVLAVVAVVAVVGVKFVTGGGLAALNSDDNEGFEGPDTTLEMTFFTEEVSDFVVDDLRNGAFLYDESSLEKLGELTSFEIGPSVSYYNDDKGKSVASEKSNYSSLFIRGQVNGERTPLGATVGKTHYAAGHTFVLRAGDTKIYLRAYDVTAKQRRLRRPIEGQPGYVAE